jgi:Protein of unknown function (DUF1573)
MKLINYQLKKTDYLLIIILFTSLAFFLYIKLSKYVSNSKTIYNSKTTSIIYLPDSVVDLGTVKQNDLLSFKFSIQNTGKNTLHVRNFSSSCGCTKIDITKGDIIENEFTEITGTIDTKNKKGESLSTVNFEANTVLKKHSLKVKYLVL